MRRGMITAPPFVPPFGSGFPGGMPNMPPLPGGIPQMPGMPPMQHQPPAPPAAQPAMAHPGLGQPAYPGVAPQPYPAAPEAAQYLAPQSGTVPYQAPANAWPGQWGAGAAYDPVAAQQLAVLQQAILAQQAQQAQVQQAILAQQAQQAQVQPFAQPAVGLAEPAPSGPAEAPSVDGGVIQRDGEPAPPVGRVPRPETYTTKGRGIEFSTRA